MATRSNVKPPQRYVPFDKALSLEQLEGQSWGEPKYDSYVVRTSHDLRKKPIGHLTDEELRLALSQEVGLSFTVPVAVERLRAASFRSGDFYRGDMLNSLLKLPDASWSERPYWRNEAANVARLALATMTPVIPSDVAETCRKFVATAGQ